MTVQLDQFDNLIRWLEIREKSGMDFPASPDQFRITMMKSSLLQRMLSGKDPLPIPPPKSYSRPWYDLIEKGEGASLDVWVPNSWITKLYNYPTLYINQFAWKVLQELGPESWLITYAYTSYDQEKFSEDTWHIHKNDNSWIIKKIIS